MGKTGEKTQGKECQDNDTVHILPSYAYYVPGRTPVFLVWSH